MNFLTENTDEITLKVGSEFTLENFRVAVVPPHLNLEAFIELPQNLTLLQTKYPEQEGAFESIFFIKAHTKGIGTIKIGYKDWDTNSNAKEKEINVTVS
ncbi:hypothetical protein SLH46_03730 [Draconibacterium sp. IB214405]|uniref:hypothetical protein n=1 Tax=Draconibacterium sp. IB214405 TaxID=3097352 RepID=UPI002A0ED9B2|nr:hypothetical protein [Draconibacterium sp. IB214405]MDX8338281.1 hypothetical protein [Draconibacterium sp. IB214405]